MKKIALAYSLFICGTCLPAVAADFSSVITDPDGKPFPSCSDPKLAECAKPFTLGAAASAALLTQSLGDERMTAEQKVSRAALALKVRDAGQLDLKAEDVAMIKDAVGKAYQPLVVYRVFGLVDPASVNTSR